MNLPDPQEQDDLLDLGLSTAFRPALTPLMQDGEAARTPPPAPPEAPPETIGRYRTQAVVARGGMGVIVRANDPELRRDVAIKLLHGRAAADPALQELFREEARIMGQLQHPGIVPVHDQGRLPDGRPYYVMHLIAGTSLQGLLRTAERARLLEVFARVCDTIAFAHSRGVVHGDLKPANIMVGEFGEVQVLDWGFARAGGVVDPTRPRILGTPAYMAPEQARGELARLDARVDVFGLGSMLCELLTGEPPYQGGTRDEVFLRASQAWLDDAFARLDRCDADPELRALTRRCLARDPAQRPADASVVARELDAHLAALARRAQELALAAAQASARADAEATARRRTLGAAVAVVLTLALGAALLVWQGAREATLRVAAERRVAGALARATLLRDRARSSGDDSAAAWTEATAVAREAEQAAEAAEVPATLRSEANALRRDIESLAATATRDAQVRRMLDEVRPHVSDRGSHADPQSGYRQLFQVFGVDVDHGDIAAVAAPLRTSQLAVRMARALHEWAHLRYRNRDEAGAGRLLELADVADPDAWRIELRRQCRGRQAATLKALAERSTGSNDASGDNLGLLAQCLVHAGDRAAAIKVFRRAQLEHPGDYWLCHDLAELLWTTPGYSRPEVTRLFSAAAAVRPGSVHALVDLAQALFEQDDLESARVVVERARTIDPSYRRLWASTSLIRERLKDLPGAVAAARELVRLEPRRSDSYLVLARILRVAGQDNEVLPVARQAVAAAPEAPLPWQLLGSELLQQGALGEAVDALRRAVALGPGEAQGWYHLGVALNDLGQDAQAVDAYRKALELAPEYAEAWCNLGQTLARTGNLGEGLVHLRRGAALGERQAGWAHPTAQWIQELEAQVALAEHLPRSVEDVDEDLPPAERARLGEVALRTGRNALALALLRDAVARDAALSGRWFDAELQAAARLAADASVDDVERGRAARQALSWLRQAVRSLQGGLEDGSVAPPVARRFLDQWLLHPAFAALRESATGAGGSASERESWNTLWSRIRDLRTNLPVDPVPKK